MKFEEKGNYVGIIILNYNNWEDTINCIDSVESFNTAPVKYIVVDNGSQRENCVIQLKDYLSNNFRDDYTCVDVEESNNLGGPLGKMTLLINKTNDGYAQGNNKALRLAYRDKEITHILILNNDVLFIEDIIPDLIAAKTDLSDSAFISPLLYKRNGVEYDYNCARRNYTNWNLIITYLLLYKNIGGYISRYERKMNILENNSESINFKHVVIDLPSGSCMFIDRRTFELIGYFDPHTFLYFEENILYKKVQEHQLKNYLIPSLHCIHLGAQSSKGTAGWKKLDMQFKSSVYYLETYGNLTKMQQFLLNICKIWFQIKIIIKRILNK